MSRKFDKVFIRAMDRFVGFIVLAVLSHLASELSGVDAYTNGSRRLNLIDVNETAADVDTVHIQDRLSFSHSDLHIERIQTAETVNEPKTFGFSPILDSVFEIPINTLNAVNNLVQRLAGNLKQTTKVVLARRSKASDEKEKVPR